MYKNRTAYTVAAIALFIMVIIIVNHHGNSSRIFASGNTTVVVDAPEKAYAIWHDKKIRGRTLVLFDNYPHARGLVNYDGPPQLNNTNLVEFSVFKNIVRRIYFIVPDAAWEDFKKQQFVHPIRKAGAAGLYLFNLNGLPTIAATPSSLPRIGEKVLVYVNDAVFPSAQAQELLSRKMIANDIIISYQGQK